MSDLHEARDPPQIDTVGWLFLAVAIAITAAAAMVAYKANDTMIANAPVSHVAVLPQKHRQLRDIGRNPPRLGEQLGLNVHFTPESGH